MAALNATIEAVRIHIKPRDIAGEENKDDIFSIMSTFEDFFIRFAEEKLNDTRRKFTYRSNQFGKSSFWFVCEFCWRTWDFPAGVSGWNYNITVPFSFKLPGSKGGTLEAWSREGEREEKEEEEDEGRGGGRRRGRGQESYSWPLLMHFWHRSVASGPDLHVLLHVFREHLTIMLPFALQIFTLNAF